MTKEKIAKLIKKVIKEFQKERVFPEFDIPEIRIEHPEEKTHGDYATNIAMIITKQVKKNPMEIANLINLRLTTYSEAEQARYGAGNLRLFEKIEVAKPGFINFFLSKEYLQKQIEEILKQGEKFGELKIGKGKKVQVEFISANPTGPLTVGNARGGPFGKVLANVLKKAGFKVEKAYYINNYGMQILALGHSVLKDEKAQYKGDYIDYLNKKIKPPHQKFGGGSNPPHHNSVWCGGREKDTYKAGELAAKIVIEEMIKKTVERMGIEYDEWFFESWLHQKSEVDKTLRILEKKNLIYEKEGAQWFKSTKFGDERDRVLVKKDGWKTYLAGDIAYHRYKFEKKKFDKVIDIWGADHYGDVPGLQAGIEALGHKGKLDIVLLQFVTLIEKKEKIKMSKRKGIFVTMDELLDEIPPDVIKYLFLQKSADTHLNFELDLAKEQSEKNPVYYIQYAYARICSILRKCKMQNAKIKMKIQNAKLLEHLSELKLIKWFIIFPEIIEDTAKDYQVQRIPQYALDLATAFHQFYRDCKVLTEDRSLQESRLALVLVTKTVLKNILNLMGISAPEKM